MTKFIISVICFLFSIQAPRSFSKSLVPADFPESVGTQMPMKVHDAWCRKLENPCRVKFEGTSMTVEGFEGIDRSQFLGFRSAADGEERYFYVSYINNSGLRKTALFLFVNWGAASEFAQSLARWYEQDPSPRPNFRFPASQGPQETHGR